MSIQTELIEFFFKRNHKTYLTLYKTSEYEGYDMAEIKEKMPAELHKKFADWSMGQTCGLLENKQVICYSWDLEAFLEGHPPLD